MFVQTNTNNMIMKLAALALASGFALFSTFAVANTDHYRSVAKNHRGGVGVIHLHPDYGNPDGPAAFGGKEYAVPGWTDEQTQYWIDNATGPKD
ncbi:MAG: hypothetical protein QOJ86_4515 [Bradyrhizobium sp.]|nr:hypothetical protein [Bradyrhizobium sp.]